MPDIDIHIVSLHLYPGKSWGAIDVNEAIITPRGLAVDLVQDRRFMLVDNDGLFISQRTVPRLALAKPILVRGDDELFDKILLNANGFGSVMSDPKNDFGSVIIDPKDVTDEQITTRMHMRGREREPMPAHIMGGEGAEWFQNFLGRDDVRLVYQTGDDIRHSDPEFSHRPGEDRVHFPDGFQILLTSEPTRAKLNKVFPSSPKPMNRFRPGMVIDGDLKANEENSFAVIRFDNTTLHGDKPCTRCNMTGVDQETGIQEGPAILKELNRTSKTANGVIFGENLVPDEDSFGPIRVGNKLTVVARKPMPEFIAV